MAVNEVRLWAVEVDGWAWHHQAERFQRHRTRQNALVNDGWLVLRFTWHDLTARPDQVLADIRRALVDRAVFVVCGTTEPARLRLQLAHHVDQLAVTVG